MLSVTCLWYIFALETKVKSVTCLINESAEYILVDLQN